MFSINYFDLVCVIPTVSLSTPGLYDCRGTLLVAVPGHNSSNARVFGQEYDLQVQPGDKTLTITRWVLSDDREGRCRTFVNDRANEIEKRKLAMEALQLEVSTKMAEFEDEYLDTEPGEIGKGLAEVVSSRGKIKAELIKLKSSEDVNVAITRTNKGESVVLPLNQLVQVSFFEWPVVYLQSKLVAAPVKITEVVEKLEVPLSAWQAEHIVGKYESTMELTHRYIYGRNYMAVYGDNIFVNRPEKYQVEVYSRKSGEFVTSFGSEGSGDGQLSCPLGMVVSGEHLFVADCNNHRVSVYTTQGVFVRTIGNGVGAGDGQLSGPTDVAVAGQHLFVADYENHRISIFSVGGRFVKNFGTQGAAPGQLQYPSNLDVSEDLVFVSDMLHNRLSVFRHDGEIVRVYELRATQVCVAGDRVFIANAITNSVSIRCCLDGTFVRNIVLAGMEPSDVAVAGDRLYVVGTHNCRVQVFS
jgi:hypothetical protein